MVGGGVAEANKGGHNEGVGGVPGLGAEEEIDAGLVDTGVGRRGLGQDHIGVTGGVEVDLGAEVELVAAELHGGLADGFTGNVRDGDLLRAKALDDTDLPAFADFGAGCGGLGEDAAGGDGGGVEAILDVEVKAVMEGSVGGFLHGEAGQVRDGDFAGVESEAQGEGGRENRNGDHGEGAEGDAEVAKHAPSG